METSEFSLSMTMIFIFLLFFLKFCSSSKHDCKPAYCGDMDPEIRFPFRLIGVQKENCGYPGFDLSCNNKSQTILTLPGSGDFLVDRIDYTAPAIYLSDPDYCLPQRIEHFNLHGSPFTGATGNNYKFYNCSGAAYTAYSINKAVPLSCLTSGNYTFLATTFKLRPDELPATCKKIENVSVPLELSPAQYRLATVLSEDIELTWNEPNCQVCEFQRLYCGLISDTGLDVGCYSVSKYGLSRSARYGITIGIGIPALLCIIGTAYYLCGKLRTFGLRRNNPSNSDIFPPAGALRSFPTTAIITGLDMKTIESYPKLTLGESRRFPNKISDSSCSICLCEYQAKETIRSIPECNHCFHANCIDEWLKLNATCPVCRNTPETPVSSSTSSVRFSSPV